MLKSGIIGYGKIGRIRHECIKANRSLELIGVCDIDSKRCYDSGATIYTDYRRLLDASPDLIFISTYNRYIPEIAVEAISRGIHVFSEKPPGRTLEDVKAIFVAAMENPKVKVKFGFNHRYHEAVKEAKTIVDSGRLGKVIWMRGIYGKAGGAGYDSNWRNNRDLSGGGILIDQGIHMLDLFRYFSGEYDEVKVLLGALIGRSVWKIMFLLYCVIVKPARQPWFILQQHSGGISFCWRSIWRKVI